MVGCKGASVSCPWFKLDNFLQYLETIDGILDIFSSFCRHSWYPGSAKVLNVWIEAAKEKAAAAQKRKEERDEQMRVKILDANR